MKNFYPIFLLLLFLIGCQTTKESPNEVINHYYQDGKFNGSILIAQNNQIVIDTVFGYRDFNHKTILTKETPFYIASLSKSFTAIAISLIAEKGLLSFDDKASKFVGNLPAYAQDISIKQLLNHT